MHGQGLLTPPRVKSNPENVSHIIRRLGFVQIDSINVVERAHNITLGTRMDGFREALLTKVVEEERQFFEGWTHDASLVPMEYYRYWWWRRKRYSERIKKPPEPTLLNSILERIRSEGPLSTSDFQVKDHKSGEWWGWSPMKVGLEYLWRTGKLAVSHRVNFKKFYDLPERVIPDQFLSEVATKEQALNWSIHAALERLGSATSRELAHFWNIFTSTEVERWCAKNIEHHAFLDGRKYWLRHDWRSVLEEAPEPSKRLRLLCPFDPLIRDRNRLKFLFDFDYRFEAFTPAAKRVYGYYVLPILRGEKLVGRADLKFHRQQGLLKLQGLWWEQGVRPNVSALQSELQRLAKRIGAERTEL